MINVSILRQDRFRVYLKRSLDLLITIFIIFVLLIPFLFICILVAKNIGFPIFFFQDRAGLNGKSFRIMKFRTMTNDRGSDGFLFPDYKRTTKFGFFLRKTSLDELPELWNVLKGEMSLVGPRPLLLEYVPLYNSTQSLRLTVLPGITGWAQINGRNNLTWDEKFTLDLWYIKHQSLLLDIKILLLTFFIVFSDKGVNKSDRETMDKFTGNK